MSLLPQNVPVRVDSIELRSVPDAELVREAAFSPDGVAVAFVATRENRYVVHFANGAEVTYEHARKIVVGPRGEISACQLRIGADACIAINGSTSRRFRWTSEPILSADGTSVGFYAMDPGAPSPVQPSGQTFYVSIDDALEGPYESQGYIGVDSINGGFFYTANAGRASFLVVRGVRGPSFDQILQPVLCPRLGAIWYWARRSCDWLLLCNGEIVDVSEDCNTPAGPFFGSDGTHFGYWKRESGRWLAMLDGRAMGTFEEPVNSIDSIAISNSGDLAFAGQLNDEIYVTFMNEIYGPFDAVGSPVISRTGGHLAFVARRGPKGFVVMDGVPGEEYEAILPEEGELSNYLEDVPALSYDGSSVAYRVRRDRGYVIVWDGEVGDAFDFIRGSPTFSPATGRLVYAAVKGNKEYVVVDRTPGEPLDRVWTPNPHQDSAMIWRPVFVENGSFVVFGALSDGQLIWRSLRLTGTE